MLFDSILLGLFGSTVYFPPNDSVCSLGLFLHCLWAPMSHFPFRHPWLICFPWASSTLFQSCFPMGLMGLPLAPYFLYLHCFGPVVAHSRFSTYYPWVCFFSFSRPIQAHSLPQEPLYELVSHSFLPLGLNGFFLLANFGLPMLLGFFSY